MATSALAKLRGNHQPKVLKTLPERVKHWGPPGASMYISTPLEVDGLIQAIPKGKLATLNTLRDALAKTAGTTIACPVTTGICVSISAQAAAEMAALGAPSITPWWRVLKSDGRLNEKYPGGVSAQRGKLEAEGHGVAADGKRYFKVVGFEAKLAKL